MSYSQLLSFIGSINPRAWDAIIPHGPQIRVTSRFDRVALNPQPLPPREAFLVGAAEMAHEVVRAATALGANEERSIGLVSELIDDWCGTPWPRKWPWPWPGPRPGGREGPQPDPWDIATARVVGAVVFASMASRLAEGDLRDTFAKGAERLSEAALGG